MKIYQFEQTQLIHADLDIIWRFFSSPLNLNRLTPPSMNFEILDSGENAQMRKGQLINYKVSPFPFVRVSWTTEISDVHPMRYFADNQVKGPFAMWLHRHTFEPITGGVVMTDHVSYSIPFGLIGMVANELLVRNRVRQIFKFRAQQIELLFPDHGKIPN